MCEDMDKLVEKAKAKGGQEASVMGAYDDTCGHYQGNVEGHTVTESAAQPKTVATPNPMKLSGGK
jgi:hypothetical protein